MHLPNTTQRQPPQSPRVAATRGQPYARSTSQSQPARTDQARHPWALSPTDALRIQAHNLLQRTQSTPRNDPECPIEPNSEPTRKPPADSESTIHPHRTHSRAHTERTHRAVAHPCAQTRIPDPGAARSLTFYRNKCLQGCEGGCHSAGAAPLQRARNCLPYNGFGDMHD
jgi:hypothetical protein